MFALDVVTVTYFLDAGGCGSAACGGIAFAMAFFMSVDGPVTGCSSGTVAAGGEPGFLAAEDAAGETALVVSESM